MGRSCGLGNLVFWCGGRGSLVGRRMRSGGGVRSFVGWRRRRSACGSRRGGWRRSNLLVVVGGDVVVGRIVGLVMRKAWLLVEGLLGMVVGRDIVGLSSAVVGIERDGGSLSVGSHRMTSCVDGCVSYAPGVVQFDGSKTYICV